MGHLKFDPAKLERLNDPARFESIRPEVLWGRAGIETPTVIVEIGAGTGLFAAKFAELAPASTVFAADTEPVMIEWMRANRAEAARGRVIPLLSRETEVPLPDAMADLVAMVNLHHELADPEALLSEALRILRPGGRLLIADWAVRETPKGPPLAVRVTAAALRSQLRAAGFVDVEADEEALPWHSVASATRAGAPARVVDAGDGPLAIVRPGTGSPVTSFALHAGHLLRPGLEGLTGVDDAGRLREEDPFTALFAPPGAPLVEVVRSRFEVDLNRPRFRAVYQGPDDAWGLPVWRAELPDEHDRVSRAVYDAFYDLAREQLRAAEAAYGRFIVLDLHSYNHRRDGADGESADPSGNPEVNVGTRHVDRSLWAPVVDAFIGTLVERGFDARENVKFGGGHLAHWVTESFPEAGCPLAIEFKKVYMDEWTGVPDFAHIARAREAVTAAAQAATRALG